VLEDVVRVLGVGELDRCTTRGRTLQRFAVGAPVDLDVLLADDDERRHVDLREQRFAVGFDVARSVSIAHATPVG
jgi:hypothetical protein